MKCTYVLFVVMLEIFLIFPAFGAEPLESKLKTLEASSNDKMSADKRAIIEGSISDLKKADVLKNTLRDGKQMPPFRLKDATGQVIDSTQLLKKGPLVIVFYRGSWCPYCNLQLHAMQERLQDIKGLGADLVAISPEKPDGALTLVEKQKLSFHVLSDPHLNVSRTFGIVYKVPPGLKNLFIASGNNLAKVNGTKSWELPLAATYVVDSSGKVAYSFIDMDFRKRAEPDDIITALEKISKNY